MEGLERLLGLNTGAHSNCRPLVALGSLPVPLILDLNALEAVGVDDERAPADTSAEEIMARVPDNEAEVVLLGKLDTLLDMRRGLGHDGQHGVVTQCTCVGWVGCGPAGVVGEVGPQASSRKLDSVVV